MQQLLGPEEALLAYLVSKKKTYVWAVQRNKADIFIADVGRKALQDAVKELRRGLDPALSQGSDLPPFNRSAAYKLFKQIFEPAEKALDGARHVFVVADGALQSLPLGVLVTGKPQGAVKGFADYRQVSWLAKKYALTTLPSVSSLRALRRFPASSGVTSPSATAKIISAIALAASFELFISGITKGTGLSFLGGHTPRQVSRRTDRKDLQLPDQQLRHTGADRGRSLPLSLAGGAVLQMDQAAPTHQALLWNFRERRQKPNLDRHIRLRARCHHQETARHQGRSLHNSTDFKPDPVRENLINSIACGRRPHNGGGRYV